MKEETDNYLTTRGRRHCFTWFGYEDVDVERLQQPIKDADYVVVGFEICPTTGKPHLQGYIEWNTGISGAQCLKRLLGRTNISPCPIRGSIAQKNRDANITYCKKSETKDPDWEAPFFESITRVKKQGRTKGALGTKTIYTEICDAMHSGYTLQDLTLTFPEQALKYNSGLRSMHETIKESIFLDELRSDMDHWKAWPWQQSLIDELAAEPDDRKIIWYVDPTGGNGKSSLCRWLCLFQEAEALENGKTGDVIHAWQGKRVVIFDIPRSAQEHINYGVMESIKNGKAFSPKYNSRTKWARTCWLIVFSNFEPDRNKFSLDRWDVRHLSNQGIDNHLPLTEESQNNMPSRAESLAFPLGTGGSAAKWQGVCSPSLEGRNSGGYIYNPVGPPSRSSDNVISDFDI